MKLLAAFDFAKRLTGKDYTRPEAVKELLTACRLEIVGEIPNGRGVTILIDAEKAEDYLRERAALKREGEASQPELHLGSLEAKVERLSVQIAGLSQEIEVLIRATNLAAERVEKLHKSFV